jgi:hypothetical protein
MPSSTRMREGLYTEFAFSVSFDGAIEYPAGYARLSGRCLITVELRSPAVAIGPAPTRGLARIL